jgi:hypothetical protein
MFPMMSVQASARHNSFGNRLRVSDVGTVSINTTALADKRCDQAPAAVDAVEAPVLDVAL